MTWAVLAAANARAERWRRRAQESAAVVERVEALADEWERGACCGTCCIKELRAALAPPARPDAAVVAGCACPPEECHAAGAPGCYFGPAPAEPVTEAQGGAE
jgi:hypothetical protein